jgi:hypothetical protein
MLSSRSSLVEAGFAADFLQKQQNLLLPMPAAARLPTCCRPADWLQKQAEQVNLFPA